MRTTLDIPQSLLEEAMKVSHSNTKTATIILALKELIKKSTISEIKEYKGKVNLEINIDELRNRN